LKVENSWEFPREFENSGVPGIPGNYHSGIPGGPGYRYKIFTQNWQFGSRNCIFRW